MQKSKTLFLCFNADGPHWDNILRLPGYPQGYSYVRPFRYKDNLIEGSLLEEINSEQERENLKGQDVFLCMRFLNEDNKWLLLPIREVKIEHIDPMPENQSVYFSMGSMYDFTGVKELSDICLEIDESERGEVGEALFFRAKIIVPNDKFEVENEDSAWVAFTNLVAMDSSLSIHEKAKHGLYIRFHGLRSNKEAKTEVIHESGSLGKMWGATLSEGNSYELIFYHRIPCLIGQNRSIKQSKLEYKIPSGNLELNHWEEDLTSNYQKHVLNVSALRPSGTYEEINIELPEEVASEDDKTIITTVKFQIPVKVKLSHIHRFKKTGFWLILIFLTLFGNVFVGQYLSKNADLKLYFLSALLSAGSVMGLYFLQQRGKNK